jgi:hypothetical protein
MAFFKKARTLRAVLLAYAMVWLGRTAIFNSATGKIVAETHVDKPFP